MKCEDSQETVGRRGLLAAVAAAGAGGPAGCSSADTDGGDDGTDGSDDGTGGSDDGTGGGGSDGGSGSDGVSGDLSCTDTTNGYEQQDVGERPIIFDFEYPAMFDELLFSQAGTGAFYRAERATGEDDSVEIQINQVTEPGEPADGESGGASGPTATFNGEEVEFTGLSSGSGLFWDGDLPYEFEGERRTFRRR